MATGLYVPQSLLRTMATDLYAPQNLFIVQNYGHRSMHFPHKACSKTVATDLCILATKPVQSYGYDIFVPQSLFKTMATDLFVP